LGSRLRRSPREVRTRAPPWGPARWNDFIDPGVPD
jgi:hypothetical protein